MVRPLTGARSLPEARLQGDHWAALDRKHKADAPPAVLATKVKMIKTKELANGKASEVFKFKIRTARSLYTLKLHSKEKADKLKQALPPALDKIDLNAPA